MKKTKCNCCKKRKYCHLYPCEIQYRSNDNILCNETICLCESCFTPDNVYVCKNHENDIKRVMCDYTGETYEESPVYYYFPEIGIRRVEDSVCKTCQKIYQVCGHHHSSPYKYYTCAECVNKEEENKDEKE